MSKKDLFLDYLKKNPQLFVSSDELATLLKVTPRTIRNYVQDTNTKYPEVIETSKEGYRINLTKFYWNYVGSDRNVIYQRRFYILRRLINSFDRGLDIYDLADTLYISESTVKADILSWSPKLNENSIKIRFSGGRASLVGDEKIKRHLILNLLDESSFQKFDISSEVQNVLGPKIKLKDLVDLIQSISVNRGVELNRLLFC